MSNALACLTLLIEKGANIEAKAYVSLTSSSVCVCVCVNVVERELFYLLFYVIFSSSPSSSYLGRFFSHSSIFIFLSSSLFIFVVTIDLYVSPCAHFFPLFHNFVFMKQ